MIDAILSFISAMLIGAALTLISLLLLGIVEDSEIKLLGLYLLTALAVSSSLQIASSKRKHKAPNHSPEPTG